jgi:polyhydroxyalkanoate synthesis regulator phasin
MPNFVLAGRLVNYPMHRFLFAGLILLTSLCGGCAKPPEPPPPPPLQLVQQSLGEKLFLSQDYGGALLEFEHDYETALAPEDRLQALYGLACTQLVLAHSDNQLSEALTNLDKWDLEKGDTQLSENRRLLLTALKIQNEHLERRHQEQLRLTKQKNSVIAHQRKKIAQMASTVDNLQKQLEELEAIDETLQEKKKPL